MKRLIYHLLTFMIFMFIQPLSAQNSGVLKYAGLSGKSITSISTEYPEDPNMAFWHLTVVAGTEDNGVYMSLIDSLPEWQHLGLNGKKVTAITLQRWGAGPIDGHDVFAAVSPDSDSTLIYKRNIFFGPDTGWTSADSGLNRDSIGEINALNSYYYTGHTAPQPVLMGASPGLYYYQNNVWTRASFDTPVGINGLDMAPHWYGGVAWASGQQGLNGVALRSNDNGKSWTKFYLPSMIENFVFSIAVNPAHPDIVYLGSSFLWVTTDNGETWETSSVADTGFRINSIVVDPVWPEYIYLGGSNYMGYFAFAFSKNSGKTWEIITSPDSIELMGVSSVAVAHISDMNGKEKSIAIIGTLGTGVWLLEIPEIVDAVETAGKPQDFQLFQNYPNPFNPNTRIQYTMVSGQHVSLKVFDLLGNEVAILVNEEQPAGFYEVEFDANAISSGVYFFRLTAGSFSQTKRMLLLK